MIKNISKPLLTVLLITALGYSFFESKPWLTLCYGLALFLFGLQCIKEGLQNSVGGSFEQLLTHSTSTKFKSFGFGVLATFFLQSSTLVSLLTMAFLSAGMINLASGIAINLGTNIGATSGLWLLASIGHNVSLSAAAMPMLVFGILFSYFQDKYKFFGRVLVGISLIFIGIDAIRLGFDNIDDQFLLHGIAVTGVAQVLLFCGVGLVITMVLQSSHATLILTLALLGSDQINLAQAFAIALGSNLGSSATTTFVGILGNDRRGQRLAIAHLIFNTSCVLLGLILWVPITTFVEYVGNEFGMNHLLQLALFHTTANFVGIVAFWPWQQRFANILYRLLPKRKDIVLFESQRKTTGAIYLQENMLRTGETAYRAVFQELEHFGTICLEVLCHVLFISPDDLYKNCTNGSALECQISEIKPPLELNAQQLYEARIKPVYSELLDFISKMEITSDKHRERINEASIVMLRMVDIIKDAKHLQKNMQIYLQKPNSSAHNEYVVLRQYLFRILCLADRLFKSKLDSAEWHEMLEELKSQGQHLDVFRTRAMKKLSDNELDGWQTSSLMNDSRYARDIANGLEEILAMSLVIELGDDDFNVHDKEKEAEQAAEEKASEQKDRVETMS